MCLSCYFVWKWSDKNIITILAVVCSFVPSRLQTLSEDLESSEKFTSCREDLESSGDFSTIPGSFRSARKLFGWLLANSVCCSVFHEALEFFETWEGIFLRNGATSKLPSMLCAWEKRVLRLEGVLRALTACTCMVVA